MPTPTNDRSIGPLPFTLAIGLLLAAGAIEAQEVVPAHVHIKHAADTFRGTPDEMGLLPTAVAEAEVAHQHATLAARDLESLEGMQRHAGHVLHALAPDETEGGPGLGYGMIRAAQRTAHYARLAMDSDGASDGLKTHANHVATAATSAATHAETARTLVEEIGEAEEASVAAEKLAEAIELLDAVLNGVDADGDGRIGWQEGEGGLAQAEQHMGLLKRGEGLGG